MAVGTIILAGAKVLGKLLLKGAKVFLKWIVKQAPKIGGVFAKFFKAHPSLAGFLGGILADGAIDRIREKIKEKDSSVTDAEIDELEVAISEFSKDAEKLNSQFEKYVNTNIGKDVSGNHPMWYFKEDKKVSLRLPEAQRLTNALLRDVFIHSYGHRLNIPSMMQTTKDKIARAIYAYYFRLSIEITDEECQTIAEKIVTILDLSMKATAEYLTKLRIDSAKNLRFDQSKVFAAGLLGSAFNMTMSYDSDALPRCMMGINLSFASSGITPWGDGSGLELSMGMEAWQWAQEASNLTGYLDTISNAKWIEYTSRLKNTVWVSQSAFEYLSYIYDSLHVDRFSETDYKEAYMFFPFDNSSYTFTSHAPNATTDRSTALGYVNLETKWEKRFNHYLDDIDDLVSSDKAIKPILALMGLGRIAETASDSWYQTFDGKRDVAGATLNVREAGDDFYQALANAKYRIPVSNRKTEASFLPGAKMYEMVNSNQENSEHFRVYYGKVKNMKSGKMYNEYDSIPSITPEQAGKLASVLKFTGWCSLVPLNVMYWNSDNNEEWVMTSPRMPASRVFFNVDNGPTQVADSVASFTNRAIMEYFAQLQERKIGPDVDDVLYRFKITSTLTGWSVESLKVVYDSNNAYRLVELLDPELVLDYMYQNLVFDVEALKELDNKLSSIDLYYATSI